MGADEYNYHGMLNIRVRPTLIKHPQSRQDRAGDAQAQKIMDDLYAEVAELRKELDAANGYIRSLENRCAMQARQLGYG